MSVPINCHCCCKKPAVRRVVLVRAMWNALCQECLDRNYPEGDFLRGDYYPPNGELISSPDVDELKERLRIAEAVRDDARAASAIDLERARKAEATVRELARVIRDSSIDIGGTPSFTIDGPPLDGRCPRCLTDLDELRRSGKIGHICF